VTVTGALCGVLIAVPTALLPGIARSEIDLATRHYTCDRGVDIPASYINADGSSVVVLHVEGRQIALYQQVSASGVRYGWPSDGANYVWLTKGDDASLLWSEAGQETPLLTCKVVP
jgi:membrane-bound inhibitor of C-type lysozyme